jgi:hypothetical protein
MATNLNPISPDALLKIVEQVKEYYVDPPQPRRRGRPRTFSGVAFLLLAVVGWCCGRSNPRSWRRC